MTTVLDTLCTILLSCKSGHIATLTLYTCVLQPDQYLAEATYIYISNYSASNQDSLTLCGRSYPSPLEDSSFFHHHYYHYYFWHRCTFYAGGFRFTPTNIEVFYETTT